MSEHQRKKNDLADALAALAAGEHTDEPVAGEGSGMGHAVNLGSTPPAAPPPGRRAGPQVPESGGVVQPPRSRAPVPRQAPMPGPTAAPRASAPTPRASTPAASKGTALPPPMRPASPNSKARPAGPPSAIPVPSGPSAAGPTPGRAPAPTTVRPPVAPPPPPPPPVELTPEEQALAQMAALEAEADAVAHVVEDDDTLNMPAPSAEAFAHRPASRAKKQLLARTVGFKQTMIPILLTAGVILIGVTVWSFVLGDESPLAQLAYVAFSLLGIGIVLLAFAVVTMLQVKHQIARIEAA